LSIVACLAPTAPALADEPPPEPALADRPAPAAPTLAPGTAASLLKEADDLIARGDREGAQRLYARIAADHPGTHEANAAVRSVWLMDALRLSPPMESATATVTADGQWVPDRPAYFALEPYSARTGERIRINTWEKLDFGVTSFIYGLTTGVSIGFAVRADESSGPGGMAAVTALTALAYTGLSAAYLSFATPDRGDLPLVLTISSYVPATVGLVALATGWEDRAALVTAALAGVVAVPAAWMAAARTNFDPGDAQLVRDAGFWGGGIAFLLALSMTENSQSLGLAGLGGLYGGMALGLVAASSTNVTLERVRLTTWGGYGGAVIGGLFSLAGDNEDGFPAGIAIGAAAGLVFTLALSSSVDTIPDDVQLVAGGNATVGFLRPAMVQTVARDGRPTLVPGIDLVGGTF
jgi:hypothetical protein